jgi:tripartite ATP-independent transporter DctP family solute receptor
MTLTPTRRGLMAGAAALSLVGLPARAADFRFRMSVVGSPTDQRSVAMTEVFGPAVADFATFEPHFNATLFKQGTELEAIARGNLDMSITSAQELATLIPKWSIFTAGYLHRDAAHQVAVFADPMMDAMKAEVEETLGVKLLSVMYLGRRHVNLRTEQEVRTPDDLAGVRLRMPGTAAWLFLGEALGANPVPLPFTEVYTALQTGAIDGQDNPLPTVRDAKFYEVTKQIVLTSHLVDLNYIAFRKSLWDELSAEQQATVQKAADDAAESARQKQLTLEQELADFFRAQGLKVYEPDVAAFRERVQKAYLASEFAKDWPAGMIDKVNAL